MEAVAGRPPFDQRFSGRFSEDANTIRGRWEKRRDSGWETDFDIVYARIRSPRR